MFKNNTNSKILFKTDWILHGVTAFNDLTEFCFSEILSWDFSKISQSDHLFST